MKPKTDTVTSQTDPVWAAFLAEIKAGISPPNYNTWFSRLKLISNNPSKLVVAVPNLFTQKQLETRFADLIDKTLKDNGFSPEKLSYQIVEPEPEPKTRSKANHNKPRLIEEVNQRASNSSDSSVAGPSPVSHNYRLNLNSRYTLDRFIVGSCNDLAYAACLGVLKNLGCKYNPLFIYGGVGTGKTHLVQALGNQVLTQKPKLRVVYVTIEQFVQEFTDSIRRKKTDHFAYRYRGADVLIIDDIQFIANKEKTQEEFFHTFNILLEANKQMVISSDKRPEEIPLLEARLCSRFQMGMSVDLQLPDLETRLAILKSKTSPSQIISEDCYLFLAENFVSSVRELEGSLKKLEVYCELKRINRATLSEAEVVFGQTLKLRKAKLTPQKVISQVASYYQLQASDLISTSRTESVLKPRQVAMYIMRSELNLSYPKIAKSLGRKDHTTAIHSINKINNQLTGNSQLKNDCRLISQSLKGH